jgi:hypothetical protein
MAKKEKREKNSYIKRPSERWIKKGTERETVKTGIIFAFN